MSGIEINAEDLKELLPKFKKALNRSTNLFATDVWGNLMEFSPQDHGRLAGSWNIEQRGDTEYIIGTNVVYAKVQNDGRGPYVIYPKKAQALRFSVSGGVVFAKHVNHPGIKGKKYIEKSIEAAESRIDDFIKNALQREGL